MRRRTLMNRSPSLADTSLLLTAPHRKQRLIAQRPNCRARDMEATPFSVRCRRVLEVMHKETMG